MKSTLKKNKEAAVQGEVSLTTEEFRPYWDAAYEDALKRVSIPGFRAGAAPRELAGGQVDTEAVFHAAANRAVRESLRSLTEEHNWRIIEGPSVEVLEASPLSSGQEKTKAGFKYSAAFTVFPEIKLGNYKRIAQDMRAELKPASVSEEEIEASLKWLRESRAEVSKVDRPAAAGDMIEADIETHIGDEPVPGGKLDHDRFVLGESRFIPGFDKELLGKAAGDHLQFTLKAPEDYWNEPLRDKSVRFSVVVHEVFSRSVPALDDAFAASLGREFQSIEAVKKNIREGMALEKETREKDRVRAKMLEKIASSSDMDIPASMVQRTLEGLVEEVGRFVPKNQKVKEEELRASLKEKAIARVKGYLVIHAIAETEGLDPTEEEIGREPLPEGIDRKQAYDYSYGVVRNRKVFEFLEKQ